MYGMPARSAASLIESRACFFVPTNMTVPPRAAMPAANSCARPSSSAVRCRSMMWMPARSP
jgi:hypothetical protein